MSGSQVLLCGATGELGGEIARRLAATGVPFRALVRPGRDASALEELGAEVVRGDLRDRSTLRPAVAGVRTVISTANSMARLLAGDHDLTIHDVDDRGYANLIAACDAANVERFVYASILGDFVDAHVPFTEAKLVTEARLRASRVHEVIVRSDMFQEVWLAPAGGFDWRHGKVTVYGRGTAHHAYVAIGDLAEAMVRLALAEDPPRVVDIAGPEAISAEEAVKAFEEALGRPVRSRHIPRFAMRIGRTVLRRPRPVLASIMGMALVGDTKETQVRDEALRELGIAARPVGQYIAEVAAAASSTANTEAPAAAS
jgi:uncharacterized protein YbjT (DUF2867 family)